MSETAAHDPADDDTRVSNPDAYAAALVADWPPIPPDQIESLRGLLYPDSPPRTPGAA